MFSLLGEKNILTYNYAVGMVTTCLLKLWAQTQQAQTWQPDLGDI